MQFVEGESLGQRLARQRRLPLDEAMPIFEQCLAGLEAAHAQGLIHRDIKPGNVLFDRERPGLAGRFRPRPPYRSGSADDGHRRGDGHGRLHLAGTGPRAARRRPSDFYSLGVMFYQLLSGRLPFTADTPTAMIFQHAYEEPFPLTKAAPDVPQPLVEIIARMMAKDPAERYDSCAAVLADLRAFREGRPVETWDGLNPSGNDVETDCQSRPGNEADPRTDYQSVRRENATRPPRPPSAPRHAVAAGEGLGGHDIPPARTAGPPGTPGHARNRSTARWRSTSAARSG